MIVYCDFLFDANAINLETLLDSNYNNINYSDDCITVFSYLYMSYFADNTIQLPLIF